MKSICPICRRKFKNAHALNIHTKLMHKTLPAPMATVVPMHPPAKGMTFTVDQMIQNLRERLRDIDIAIRELEDFKRWMGQSDG